MPEFVINVGGFPDWDKLDEFTRGYVEALFFTSTDGEHGECSMNDTHSVADLTPEAWKRIKADCKAFQRRNGSWIESGFIPNARHPKITAEWRAGTDFLYSRCGHGVGFWERDRWTAEAGDKLQAAAERYQSVDLYVGDDGRLYL